MTTDASLFAGLTSSSLEVTNTLFSIDVFATSITILSRAPEPLSVTRILSTPATPIGNVPRPLSPTTGTFRFSNRSPSPNRSTSPVEDRSSTSSTSMLMTVTLPRPSSLKSNVNGASGLLSPSGSSTRPSPSSSTMSLAMIRTLPSSGANRSFSPPEQPPSQLASKIMAAFDEMPRLLSPNTETVPPMFSSTIPRPSATESTIKPSSSPSKFMTASCEPTVPTIVISTDSPVPSEPSSQRTVSSEISQSDVMESTVRPGGKSSSSTMPVAVFELLLVTKTV